MANNLTSSNEKYFHRNESLDPTTDVPRDLTWSIRDPDNFNEAKDAGPDNSVVSSIVFEEDSVDDSWRPNETGSIAGFDDGRRKCPTPIITEVVSQKVRQNDEGIAKVDVVLAINCIDNVEYEVVVTPA